MLRVATVAVPTFFTTSVRLYLFLWDVFNVIVIHCNTLDVYLWVSLQNKRTGIYVPPVTCLVLDEVTHQLIELGLEMALYKAGDALHIGQSLF